MYGYEYYDASGDKFGSAALRAAQNGARVMRSYIRNTISARRIGGIDGAEGPDIERIAYPCDWPDNEAWRNDLRSRVQEQLLAAQRQRRDNELGGIVDASLVNQTYMSGVELEIEPVFHEELVAGLLDEYPDSQLLQKPA